MPSAESGIHPISGPQGAEKKISSADELGSLVLCYIGNLREVPSLPDDHYIITQHAIFGAAFRQKCGASKHRDENICDGTDSRIPCPWHGLPVPQRLIESVEARCEH